MQAIVWVEPHERGEAISAYGDYLTEVQVAEIKGAPETALVNLRLNLSERTGIVLIVPEG